MIKKLLSRVMHGLALDRPQNQLRYRFLSMTTSSRHRQMNYNLKYVRPDHRSRRLILRRPQY